MVGVGAAAQNIAPPQDVSGPASRGAVLLELFTSEGCSSCPPADALLKKLNGMKSPAGQLIVGISEHVTYWNQLGWADPFSAATYTDRQSAYGDRFRLESVYTPQMVINGEVQTSGGDREAILRTLAKPTEKSGTAVKIESVAGAETKSLSVTFSVAGVGSRGVDVYAVIADDMATSSVLRGENGGRTLSHVSVARSLSKVATMKDAKTLTVELPMPAKVAGQAATTRHLIVFAQERGLGRVLAVEAQPL
jgi:hypothetical protein